MLRLRIRGGRPVVVTVAWARAVVPRIPGHTALKPRLEAQHAALHVADVLHCAGSAQADR